MLKNYFITALRTLQKNKIYTIINVIGLALGIGCSLVIFKIVMYETSFDKHQNNLSSIYRISSESIYSDRVDKGMGTPHPVGPSLKADYPEILEVVRTFYTEETQINVENEYGYTDKFIMDEGIVFTENAFFRVFTTEWIAGNQEEALKEPNTAVISLSVARKLFGLSIGNETDAVGRKLNLETDFTITGIIADPPATTNFPFTVLLEYEGQAEFNDYYFKGKEWNSTSSSAHTYILAPQAFNPKSFDKKLIDFVEKHYSKEEVNERRFVTQSIVDLRFDEDYGSYVDETPKEILYALAAIGIFLILTACINFINLATAQASNRAREIGVRRAIGVKSHQLISQFMLETAFVTGLSILASLGIAELIFSQIEQIIGYKLMLDLNHDLVSLLFLFFLFIIVSLISGFYPSLLLTKMEAALALKSKITNNVNGKLSLRKGLVIFQFVLSQFLIASTIIVSSQIKYLNNKKLGFIKDSVVISYLPDQDELLRNRFKEELLKSPSIIDITYSLSQPTGSSKASSNIDYEPLESEDKHQANFISCDERYADFFGLELLAGRTLQKSDSSTKIVVNRKIADFMGFKDNYEETIGQKLYTGWGGDKEIIGVTENFHTRGLKWEIDYSLLIKYPKAFYSLSFKISSMKEAEAAIDYFEKTWAKIYPDHVLDYRFYDEELQENYEVEKGLADLLKLFSLIAIIIGCLGLYGLISFIAIKKTKEIGVRKVLGASAANILTIFSKEILGLNLIATLIGAPLAYYVMSSWLEEYVYRIDLNMVYFIISFFITMIIALLTISHRALSTALINPAETLKDD